MRQALIIPGDSDRRSAVGQPRAGGKTVKSKINGIIRPVRRELPAYLREVYSWAYLNPRNARLLDNEVVVNTILWGNSGRLRRALLAEITAGDRVLQAAHVYGRMIPDLARAIGPQGGLDVVEIAPLQAALCRRKLRGFTNAQVHIGDASCAGKGGYDVAISFFLLHELPNTYKRKVVNALLARISPGGKAVFIDYSKPVSWHPLRNLMQLIFTRFEPFARNMWQHQIQDFACDAKSYSWHTETYFGGLYQKVTVRPLRGA